MKILHLSLVQLDASRSFVALFRDFIDLALQILSFGSNLIHFALEFLREGFDSVFQLGLLGLVLLRSLL